jgi:hypothetical protein
MPMRKDMEMKKLFVLMLAVALVITLIPSAIFASSASDISQTKTAATSAFTVGSGDYAMTFSQPQVNHTSMRVHLDNRSALVSKGITKFRVDVTMSYDGNVTQETSVTKTLSSMGSSFNMEFPGFGQFKAKVTFYKDTHFVQYVWNSVNVIADEYNIAPLVATFPVVLFSLNLPNITTSSSGEPIPTFVSLQRPAAYNWDSLPDNVYWQPNLTKSQVMTQTSFADKVAKFKDYVAMLHETNPNAKFHLFINDAYGKYILQLMCANGIPDSQYDVVMLSDGSGSYSHFNSTFDIADPQTKYDQMKSGWAAAKDYAYNNGTYSISEDITPYWGSSNYAAVIANEDSNVTWWVARKSGTFTSVNNNGTFLAKYITPETKVLSKNMSNMLSALNDSQKASFKALYNFNDQMFSQAKAQNKKVMMILGTRVTGEPASGAFKAYAKFLMRQYGDDYVYYYKGHPATPTSLYPEKQAELNELGIYDVESSIPAELILYFYPDIYMAGYSSSTFNSVESDEMATGVFGKTRAQARDDSTLAALEARDAFNFYMSHYTGSVDIGMEYPGANKDHDNYLVEFSNSYLASKGNTYDVAVYDYTDNTLSYFKKQADNTYKLTGLSIGDITGVKSSMSSDNTLKISWSPISNVEGYEIAYKGKYDGAEKTVTVTDAEKMFSLVKGQTFEYRIRAYKSVNGEKFYGSWSSVERVFASNCTPASKLDYSNKTIAVTGNNVVSSYGKITYRIAYKTGTGDWKNVSTGTPYKVLSGFKAGDTTQIRMYPVKTVNGYSYEGTSTTVLKRYMSATSISSIYSPSKSKISLSLSKFSNATGYQISYATRSSFSNASLLTTKGASNIRQTLSNLKSGSKYYVKARPIR